MTIAASLIAPTTKSTGRLKIIARRSKSTRATPMHTTTAAPPTEPKTISTWLLRTTQAIDINPQCADAYFNRGTIFETKGAYDLAIADFTQVIQIKPQDADAYLNRGLAYRAKEEIDNAIADYSKAIDLNPRYANALPNRGTAYQSKGDHDQIERAHV